MQDIGLIEGGRILEGGGEGGVDRRLRPHNHHAALKCPRCDSLNTKFCYYNNYNLSQQRYFCKGCRRYWTKGGILRKVPVGGGCRKAKLSKTKPSAASADTAVVSSPHDRKAEVTNNNNNSSSGGTSEAVSAVTSHSTLYGNSNDLRIEHGSDGGIFSEIGSLTSMISSSKNETLPFDFGTVLNKPDQWQKQQGFFDETLRIEQPDLNSKLETGFQPLDWEGIGDHQWLFDDSNGVDHTYWDQNQWTYQDHPTLYPP